MARHHLAHLLSISFGKLLLGSAVLGLVSCVGHSGDTLSGSSKVDAARAELAASMGAIGPQANSHWRLDAIDLSLKWIPAGTFYLGSTQAERDWAADPDGGKGRVDWFTDEPDLIKAEMEYGFWMGKTTITKGMFRQFVEAENYQTAAEQGESNRIFNIQTRRWEDAPGVSWRDPGHEQDDDHPVVFVSWNDAMAFCDWLNRIEHEKNRLPEGYEYRLPGEFEWEYAARGGKTEHAKFWWGNDFSDGEGRLNGAGADRLPDGSRWVDNYDWEDGFVYTSPVDFYGPRGRNGFGLADIMGNVWEWCYDGYHPSSPQATIWLEDTSVRMLRGASYMRPAGSLRVANRGRGRMGSPLPHRGFRVVLAPVVESMAN